MGRLKKDHGSYRASGLWLRYQSPKVNERPIKIKSKKDTNRWCRGKIGLEHTWHRFQQKDDFWGDKFYTYIKCVECGKEKYAKTAKSANYPLHIWVDEKFCGYDPIQVRVNGLYEPLTIYDYRKGMSFCHQCGFWH